MYRRKNPGKKLQELTNLKFSGRLFVSESVYHKKTAYVEMPTT